MYPFSQLSSFFGSAPLWNTLDGGTFAITADDYQKVADGEVLFSLKEYIGEVPFKLL